MGQDGPKVAPRRPQGSPKRAQDGFKMAQLEAKIAHYSHIKPKMEPSMPNNNNFKRTQGKSMIWEGPGPPGEPKMRPRWLQDGPKTG